MTHLPRLTYLLLDEHRLDLGRHELQENRTAAVFRIETNEAPALPRLFRHLKSLVKPGESALNRTIHAWLAWQVQRATPDGIIPEGIEFEEASMLAEKLAKWRDEGIREARRDVLLRQMTLRFGQLPEAVRRKVEQITSDKKLERLEGKVLSAKSLREMGLG